MTKDRKKQLIEIPIKSSLYEADMSRAGYHKAKSNAPKY